MAARKADIIAQLQKDILPLQGFKQISNSLTEDVEPGPIKYAFPNEVFPLGAVHEFLCKGTEDIAATGGFIAGILAKLMRYGGASLWITSCKTVFPPALKSFSIDPDKIVFVYLQNERDIMWAMEEALKCRGLAAVVAEMKELSFTASRRFQLAVEQSNVTGFILRCNPRNLNTTACITRWKITPLPTIISDDMPGVGFPCWNVELLKIRNGKPGSWQIEWFANSFRHIAAITSLPQKQRKTG